MLDRRFTRPSAFDAGEYWNGVAARVGGEDSPYVATFRMTRRGLANATVYCTVESRTRVRGSAQAEWLVRIAFASFEAAVHEAMGWSDDGVAVDPPSLRASVHQRASALAGLYEER